MIGKDVFRRMFRASAAAGRLVAIAGFGLMWSAAYAGPYKVYGT
jgi:hypothetical protein